MDSGLKRVHLDLQLVEENRRLRASIKVLRDIQLQRLDELRGNVSKREFLFDASCHGKKPSSVEGALSEISRLLIEAQEQERARIARELHDDINQRLALVAVGIEQARHAACPEVDQGLRELKRQLSGIAADIQTMAHNLHSSSLEYLGFVPAVRKLAEELGKRQGMQIEVKTDSVSGALAAEISLCLFRIIQEGLHNAAKHSGAKRVVVRLLKASNQIRLVLSDSGKRLRHRSASQ